MIVYATPLAPFLLILKMSDFYMFGFLNIYSIPDGQKNP